MRDPSIHITKSTFEEILKTLEVNYFPTDAFFLMARKASVDSRLVISSNKKTTNKVNKITLASHGDANLAAELIYAIRIKLRHRGVRKINQSDPKNWDLCKKLAEICNTFCNDFKLDTRAGFITYIEMGIKRINSNRNLLQKLINMAESLTIIYESKVEVDEAITSDSVRRGILQVHDIYVKYIANFTGIYEDFKDKPDKYVHFCRTYQLINKNKWGIKEYITAQFEALAFCNGVPPVESLYGDKAIERFNKYRYSKKSSLNEGESTPVVEGSLWSKINR